MTITPGWYQDPGEAGLLRWWDGTAWTQHTSPNVLEIGLNRKAVHDLQGEYTHLKSLVVELREKALLQEVGFYEYAHPLDSQSSTKRP